MQLTWDKTIKNFKEYNINFREYKDNIGYDRACLYESRVYNFIGK